MSKEQTPRCSKRPLELHHAVVTTKKKYMMFDYRRIIILINKMQFIIEHTLSPKCSKTVLITAFGFTAIINFLITR